MPHVTGHVSAGGAGGGCGSGGGGQGGARPIGWSRMSVVCLLN